MANRRQILSWARLCFLYPPSMQLSMLDRRPPDAIRYIMLRRILRLGFACGSLGRLPVMLRKARSLV